MACDQVASSIYFTSRGLPIVHAVLELLIACCDVPFLPVLHLVLVLLSHGHNMFRWFAKVFGLSGASDDQAATRPSRGSQTSPWMQQMQHNSMTLGNMEYAYDRHAPQFQSMSSLSSLSMQHKFD
jgi:hypothetical protein